jgi:hypothetical protein
LFAWRWEVTITRDGDSFVRGDAILRQFCSRATRSDSPGFYTAYAVKTLPGVREGIAEAVLAHMNPFRL